MEMLPLVDDSILLSSKLDFIEDVDLSMEKACSHYSMNKPPSYWSYQTLTFFSASTSLVCFR